jgi:hypothetical protein
MRNGTSTSFIKVPILSDNGLITKAYLRDMEAAIKQRTPIAGENITIKVTDGSYVISSTATNVTNTILQNTTVQNTIVSGGDSGGGGRGGVGGITLPVVTAPSVTPFREIVLNVCSNGTPGTIIVFGPIIDIIDNSPLL